MVYFNDGWAYSCTHLGLDCQVLPTMLNWRKKPTKIMSPFVTWTNSSLVPVFSIRPMEKDLVWWPASLEMKNILWINPTPYTALYFIHSLDYFTCVLEPQNSWPIYNFIAFSWPIWFHVTLPTFYILYWKLFALYVSQLMLWIFYSWCCLTARKEHWEKGRHPSWKPLTGDLHCLALLILRRIFKLYLAKIIVIRIDIPANMVNEKKNCFYTKKKKSSQTCKCITLCTILLYIFLKCW